MSRFTYLRASRATACLVGSDLYNGKEWDVDFRLHAVRTETLGDGSTVTCESDSPPVRVKKVTGVDP